MRDKAQSDEIGTTLQQLGMRKGNRLQDGEIDGVFGSNRNDKKILGLLAESGIWNLGRCVEKGAASCVVSLVAPSL